MAKYLITGVSGFVARRFIWVKIVRSPPQGIVRKLRENFGWKPSMGMNSSLGIIT
jgi:hypothetical protein